VDIVTLYVALRILARSLRAGDARSAGEQLDRDLDGVTGWFDDLLQGACGCYLGWIIICLAGGVVYALCDLLGYLLRGR
jgi:cobalamin biosynthesis protein CbiG